VAHVKFLRIVGSGPSRFGSERRKEKCCLSQVLSKVINRNAVGGRKGHGMASTSAFRTQWDRFASPLVWNGPRTSGLAS